MMLPKTEVEEEEGEGEEEEEKEKGEEKEEGEEETSKQCTATSTPPPPPPEVEPHEQEVALPSPLHWRRVATGWAGHTAETCGDDNTHTFATLSGNSTPCQREGHSIAVLPNGEISGGREGILLENIDHKLEPPSLQEVATEQL